MNTALLILIALLLLADAYLFIGLVRTHQRIQVIWKNMDTLGKCLEMQQELSKVFMKYLDRELGEPQPENGDDNPELN